MVAVAGRDAVVAAQAGQIASALDGLQHLASHFQRHRPVVAYEEPCRGPTQADVDDVTTDPADHHLGAAAGRHDVRTAGELARVERAQHRGCTGRAEHHLRVVAEHDVVAVARGNQVCTHAAEDDVVGCQRRDLVIAAQQGVVINRFDREHQAAICAENQLAVVTADDTADAVHLDGVIANAADNDVAARCVAQFVVAAHRVCEAFDLQHMAAVDQAVRAGSLRDDPMVAQ